MNNFISLPSPALKPFVSHYCYANYTSSSNLEQGSFPYGGSVLSISLLDEVYNFKMNGVTYNQKSNLAGILEKATYIERSKSHKFFLIFFTPLGIYKLTGIPQSETANTFVDLVDFFKDSEHFREKLSLAKRPEQLISIAEVYLLKKIIVQPQRTLYDYALRLMIDSNGTIRINALCKYLNVSQRSFERNFKQIVGISPKSYNRVLRLEHVYRKLMSTENFISFHDIIFNLGYFDQAHFIHDLKKYTDNTPRTILSSSIDIYNIYFNHE